MPSHGKGQLSVPLLANTRRHRPKPLAQGHRVSNRIGQNSRSQGSGQILEAGFSHSVAPLRKHARWEPWLSVTLQVAQEKAESVPGMLPTTLVLGSALSSSPVLGLHPRHDHSASTQETATPILPEWEPLSSFMFPGREGGGWKAVMSSSLALSETHRENQSSCGLHCCGQSFCQSLFPALTRSQQPSPQPCPRHTSDKALMFLGCLQSATEWPCPASKTSRENHHPVLSSGIPAPTFSLPRPQTILIVLQGGTSHCWSQYVVLQPNEHLRQGVDSDLFWPLVFVQKYCQPFRSL